MTKSQVLDYLNAQLEKLQESHINFDIWKSSVMIFLQRNFGGTHVFVDRLREVEPEFTMSYEELYPQKIINTEVSISKFTDVINAIVAEVKLMQDQQVEDETNAVAAAENEIADLVVEALKNNLTGAQVKQLKSIVETSKDKELQGALQETVRTLDIEVVNQILAEILASKALWDRV